MQDIQFNDATIDSFDNIPTNTYPSMDNVYTSAFLSLNTNKPAINGVLFDSNGTYFSWRYPI